MALFDIPQAGSLETEEDIRNYLFRVDRSLRYLLNGKLGSMNLNEIGGWYVDENQMSSLSGNVGFSTVESGGIDLRIWAGSVDPNTAPFRVYDNGAVFASMMTISGGSINWGTTNPPTPTDVGALATDSPMLTYIGPTGIYTGVLNANQINVGTLTGFTIQTGFSGQRVVVDPSGLRSYDIAGVKRIAIESAGNYSDLLFYDSSGLLAGSMGPFGTNFTIGGSNGRKIQLVASGVELGNSSMTFDFKNATILGFTAVAKFG